jgi:hypothetical protein
VGVASLAAAGISRTLPGRAQEVAGGTPVAVASPSAGIGNIQPIGVGPVPSTGGRRPGPVSLIRFRSEGERVAPIGLTIEAAGIDASIEALQVVDGAMQDPTGPWVVAWYENLGSLGRPGNVVMAGHIDYWNVGPSVFYNLAALQSGNDIDVAGSNGETYSFTVDWVRQYDAEQIPLDEVVGPTPNQTLTLLTCGGAFDYVNGHYLSRTVVRAHRVTTAGTPTP